MHSTVPNRLRVLITIGFLVLGPLAHAAIEIKSTGVTPRSVAPQGSDEADMLFFKVEATAVNETVKRIQLSNTSSNVFFGKGINSFSIFQDDGNESFDSNDSNLRTETFTNETSGSVTITLASSVSISQDSSRGFHVVYDISDTAAVGQTTSIQLVEIQNDSGTAATIESGAIVANTVTISGVSFQEGTQLSPEVVLPNQEKVPVLQVALVVTGENMQNDDIQLTITNDSRNLSTTSSDTTGVTAVYLYEDSGNGLFETDGTDTLLKTISGGSFTSQSVADISFTASDSQRLRFSNGVTKNLFIAYDIGEDFPVTEDGKIEAQLTAFTGTGSASGGLTISLFGSLPNTAVSSKIGGLRYDDSFDIVPDNQFGPQTQAPMLAFQLKGENVSVTLNEVTIRNDGSVEYITNAGQTDGVTQITVYQDNGNEEFDGENSNDTLIGDLVLGFGSGQTASVAPIPISIGANSDGLFIPTGQIETLFAVYDLGKGIRDSATTIDAQATLEDAVGSANIVSPVDQSLQPFSVSLSGLPDLAVRPTASVRIIESNLTLVNVTDISPSLVVRGQQNVPMLYVEFSADEAIASASVQFFNSRGSFFNTGAGVHQIKVFHDVDQDQVLDESDTLVSATTSFDSPTLASMPIFDIPEGISKWLVYYDIGQLAEIGTSNIAAQVENVVSTGNATTISLTGELPNPKFEALLDTDDAFLTLLEAGVNTSTISDLSTTFNAHLVIRNDLAQAVSVTDASPRFYRTAASGPDVSFEYDIALADSTTFPFSMTPAQTVTLNFQITPSRLSVEGTVFVDGIVSYEPTTNAVANLSRFLDDNGQMQFRAATSAQLSIQTAVTQYDWTIPDYISDITLEVGSQTLPFENFDAIPANSVIVIQLADTGKFIDEASLNLTLNNATIDEETGGSGDSDARFEFKRDTGVIRVFNLGDNDGTLTLSVTDIENNPLPDAELQFFIASVVRIEEFLPFPSPYQVGGPLKFGMSLTQPATVTLYMFDMLGQLVWQIEESFDTLGYKQIDWDGRLDSGKFLASGPYIIRLVAEDDEGNTAVADTKLAVY